jgi:nucleotide-binding universal stress UspA family protein
LATTLAEAFDVQVSTVHIDGSTETVETAGDATPEEVLAAAICRDLPADGLLVIESEHADRWRSRHSVAEHTIDAFPGSAVAIGPAAGATLAAGPVIVALDGSPAAELSLATAVRFGEAIDRELSLVRVIGAPLHPEATSSEASEARAYLEMVAATLPIAATTVVVESNDPVSSIVATASDQNASLVALASRGDRSTARGSMSRTAAGVIAEAPCPVLVIGSSGH